MTRESTQIKSEPSSVTAQRGMESIKPTSSMTLTSSSGNVVADIAVSPEESMMVVTMPWATRNAPVISSMPHDTAACASTKRMKHLKATSGFFISVKLPQVLTTPITKNSTNSAYPTAFNPSLMFTMTFQTPPPLKDSGEVLISCQISASLPFHISSAEFKLSTIQFPLPIQNHLLREEQGERYHAVHPAAFFSR